jgi:protein phosphatase
MLPEAGIVQQLATQTVVRAVPDMVATATAIAGPKSDNTTALAIMWQGAGEEAADGDESLVSTRMLAADEVSTTIAATPEPAAAEGADVFDEDEIEKAIAEIRDAIEKSSQLLK